MKTWNKETKDKFLVMAKESLEGDAFKQGQWLNKDSIVKGAFCGCMHGRLTQLGEDVLSESAKAMQWPLWLTHLSERMFEGLSSDDCGRFVVDLIDAVPVETDIDSLNAKLNIARMERLKVRNPELSDVFDGAIEVWNLLLRNDKNVASARSARSAEWSARSAELSAAESAELLAAESAAWSAAESAAESEWLVEAKTLISFLKKLR